MRGRLQDSESLPSPSTSSPFLPHLALPWLPHALGSVCHGWKRNNATAVLFLDSSVDSRALVWRANFLFVVPAGFQSWLSSRCVLPSAQADGLVKRRK